MQDRAISKKQLVELYSIRISNRAKYIRLHVSLAKGLVVVVPKGMTRRQIDKLVPEFVKEKKQWIRDAFEKLQGLQPVIPVIEHCHLPEQVVLKALEQVFIIDYCLCQEDPVSLVQEAKHTLKICGNLHNTNEVFFLLERFFKEYARFYLQKRLDELSKQFCLPYNRLTIRAQKTRWGSCSNQKNINLNYRLIFIAKEQMDYIMLHELSHTIHMNHSKLFWATLETLMPGARKTDKQVNQAVKSLPCWIFYK